MAKTLANYDPLVQIPSGMTPAGADFPIVESHDILVGENDKRLDAKLDDIDSAIGNVGQTPIATQLSSKVNTGDIVTSVAATGSTSNNKIPSETAVRAAIEAKTINVDSTVTQGSTNAVSGGAVHTQLATKQDTLTFDTTPTASSSNPVTSGGVKAALDNKQNTLTYETTPIVGSVNPVTSTGIRNAIDAAAAGNLGQMQAAYDTFSANISARVSSLSNGMVACSNIDAETTVGDTRILLYTGTTNSTYTNGHWYYNSAASNAAPSWTDGGAVGSAPTIDNTLTVEGAAANSKAVGDAIENIVTISNTQPGSNSGNKVWIRETTNEEVQVPTYAEHIAKANKADIATNNESDNGSGTISASKAYAIGDHFYINNTNTSSENYGVSTLYKATAAIASGDAIVVGTNCEASKVADEITSLSNDLDNVRADLSERAINTDSTLHGFIQGSISASGSNTSSDKHCRLYYQQFPGGLYSFTALNGYRMLCNDYGTNKVFAANIFNDVSEISGLKISPDHYYYFCVWKADGTDLPISSLPENVITCTKTDFTDTTLMLAGKAADAKATGNISAFFGGVLSSKFSSSEFEIGRYFTTTASSGSSAVPISISPDDNSGTARLGIRSKVSLDKGFMSNIDRLVSTGSIYMYIIGVNRNTHECLGYYYDGAWRTSAKPIYAQQDINIAALIAAEPNLSVKLCIVDVSTEAQITPTDEVLSNVTIYFSPGRQQINEYDEHFGSIDIALAKLPEYYNSDGYFDGKIASIKENMCAVGKHGFTFAFLTDLHWQINNRKSPVLLKNIMDKVSVNDVICGGDLIGQGTKEEAVDLLSACINAFRFYGIIFPVTYGNHDGNWNTYAGQREHPERKLSFNEIYALIEAQYDKYSPVYYMSEGFNFYIDYPNTNTRVIFIDTGDTRELDGNSGIFWRDYETFADLLMNSGDKNIIVVPHAVALGIGTSICRISNSYNARQQHSASYLTYDFTNAQGHVYLVIGGHGHQDIITTPDEGGISWVMTDTDSTDTNTGLDTTAGTINEQAFDVVTVDYSTGNVQLVRIGRGSDRSIPQN